jgi:hypothetical protein
MTKKRVSFFTIAALTAALGFFTGASGCDEVETTFDCSTVCDRYRDCFDTSYNTDACQDRCEGQASVSDAFQAAVDACEDCIGVNSCLSQTFNCPSCDNIVP